MEQWKKDLEELCKKVVKRQARLTISKLQEEYGKKEVNTFITKWLIRKHLRWNKEQIKKSLTKEVFVQCGLRGFLYNQYTDSVYDALEEAYPKRYLPWELKRVPRDFWNKKRAIQVIKTWLEEKVKWSDEEICQKFTKNYIQKTKPYGGKIYWALRRIFEDDAFKALEAIYPNKFKQEGEKIVLNQ